MSNTATYQDILCFWFEEATPSSQMQPPSVDESEPEAVED